MPNIHDVFGGTGLKPEDLPQGMAVPCVIEAVKLVKFDNGDKLEIRFAGKQKTLISNRTNSGRIAAMFGDETDFWIGKQISLNREMCDFMGDQVACIRVVQQNVQQAPGQPTYQPGVESQVQQPTAPAPAQQPPAQPPATQQAPAAQGPPKDEIPF